MAKHVAVLMGGRSAEREVSLVSGTACAGALREVGYRVTEVDVTEDVDALIAALSPRPDVAFNALHGRFGEDGWIQGLLNLMNVPYTHSGVLASALAMNKVAAKRAFAAAGIPVPDGVVASRAEILSGESLHRPCVVKPINEGSSVHVHILFEEDDGLGEDDWPYQEDALVEPYIPGRELTVAVMGERALAVTEIRAHNHFYDYTAKYTDGRATHLIPAPIAKPAYESALSLALKAHETLGCRGVSRADFRYDDTGGEPGDLYLLEVNTQPGMTPLSLVPEQASHCGISFNELVTWMVERAACD